MSNIFDWRCSKINLRHQFENGAANNSWNVQQWRAQLLMALEGPAAKMVAGFGDLSALMVV